MKRLKTLREQKGMKQDELAQSVGVSRSTVAMWESGAIMPGADKLPLIADALGCSIDALYGREPSGDEVAEAS